MSAREIVICSPVRTAIGAFGGSLKDVTAPQLGAAAIRGTLQASGLTEVDTVIMGNVIQAGAKMNPARQAAIGGGLPVQVPALTVNRVCGSGAQAIASAALEILSGYTSCAVAGGMENMDQAPYLVAAGRWGYRMGDAALLDSMLRDGLNDAFSGQHSGWHTEDLATRVVAVEPGMFGIGPVPAVRLVLERAGWKLSDVDRIEINEAFAAIAIACQRELGFSEDVVNVEGGAIAHGHAIGATGAVLTTRLLHSMKRDGLKRGIVTMCIGGGQGIALALEIL
jgi:acetyl-CoA acetyltransferase